MRLTKEQAAKNRQHILQAAERLFREKGFDGVGVADLMKAAGFTHGGFYNHFESKEALAAEVCACALERGNKALAEALEKDKERACREFLDEYLSLGHRDDPASGCTVAALAADAGRQGKEIQASFSGGLAVVLDILTAHTRDSNPGLSKAEAREQTLRTWSEVVGAVVLARSVADANPKLSKEILDASRRKLLA